MILNARGVKLNFILDHISMMVALKGLVVTLRLYKYIYSSSYDIIASAFDYYWLY